MSGFRTQQVMDHLKGPIGSFLLHILVILLAFWLLQPVEKKNRKMHCPLP